MRTIQMTLDDNLVNAVDRVSKELHTSRSAFTRKALQDALVRYKLEQEEQRHRRGYEQNPVATDEFSSWETEQAWGDE
jgi:metal-responsive CopG/Arc/MetJ family transcriptional regulator